MNLVVVNYHYIDDEDKYKAGIYPISTARLRKQLTELKKSFVFISEEELLLSVKKEKKLPENCCMITFDDGLKTQYDNALPVLEELEVPAVFFVNTLPYISGEACTVHKIWSLLSLVPASIILKKVIFYYKEITGEDIDFGTIDNGRAKRENKYEQDNDTRELKYLLNSLMNPDLASKVIRKIFNDYFDDELKFCRDTYLSKEQIVLISKHKLFSIGLHTNSHVNIPHSSEDDVEKDIVTNFEYLKNNLKLKNIKGISYPIGAIEEEDVLKKVESIVKPLGIEYGFALNREVNHDLNNPLLLKRFDTNDVNGGKYPIINLTKV